MRVRISKHRKGAAIRLPAEIMDDTGLVVGQIVEIRADGGRVMIERVTATRYDLDSLFEQMTQESFPDLPDFAPERGREAW